MNCNTRHICKSDLKAYLRKDDYFYGYTLEEKEIIIKNLGLDKNVTGNVCVEVTYEELQAKIQTQTLKVGNKYLVTDFQTMYQGEELNNFNVPSTVTNTPIQPLLLTAVSDTEFDPRAILLTEDEPLVVLYDVIQVTFPDNVKSKGTITYMRDKLNNSAFYDFKVRDTFKGNAENVSLSYNVSDVTFLGDIRNLSVNNLHDVEIPDEEILNTDFPKLLMLIGDTVILRYMDEETLTELTLVL